jgi:type IX secretion system PorP/SprF family membrane protein
MNINRTIIKGLWLSVFTCYVIKTEAQQIPLYSQYFYNQLIYNPAQTGLAEAPQLYAIYRKQWVGFEGSPETRAFTFEMPMILNKAGIGVYLFSDVTNIFRKNGGYFSYAYHIRIKERHLLSVGLSAGLQENRIDFAKVLIKDYQDILITNNAQRAVTADGAAGIHYRFKGLNIGISVPQLVSGRLRYIDNNQKMGYRLSRHYLASASYQINIVPEKLSVSPLVLFRTSETFAYQIDAGFNLKYKDFIWLGAMYRYQSAVAMAAGIKIHQRISLGYSYDLPVNSIADYTSGSHELMLGINLGKRTKIDDIVQKEMERYAAKFSQQDSLLNELQKQVDSLHTLVDTLDRRIDSLENQAAGGSTVTARDKTGDEQWQHLKKQLDDLKKQLADSLKSYEEKMQLLKNLESSSERTKIIPREDIEYVDGPPLGDYYLVVGSFKIKENSFKFKKQLEQRGYTIGIVYNKKRNWYYVYMAQKKDAEQTGLEELYKIREEKKDEFSDAWIYILR